MKRRPASVTLYVHPASASPLALVVRRGPSKCWHFMLWDRDTGIITPGSWFEGMLYPQRCDLSPRGDWMVMLAYSGRREPVAWTALCTPPHAAAKVFWQQPGTKAGGGFFDGRLKCVWINLDAEAAHPEFREPCSMEIGYREPEQPLFGTVAERLERDGWRTAKAPPEAPATVHAWRKPSPRKDREIFLMYPASADDDQDASALFSAEAAYGLRPIKGGAVQWLEDCSWANWNSRGELCLVRQASLWAEGRDGTLRLVADLTELERRPRLTPAPAEKRSSGEGAQP